MTRSVSAIAMLVAAALAILVLAGTAAAAMPPVPYFSQCDSRWESDQLGGDGPTICSQGCALTSAAMVMAYYGVDIDPKRLNDAIGRGGYDATYCIKWSAVRDACHDEINQIEYSPGTIKPFDTTVLNTHLDAGHPVIVNVGCHFVVVTGRSDETYYINDPISSVKSTLDAYPTRVGMHIYSGNPPDINKPLVGDWNGNGTDTTGIYNYTTANFSLDSGLNISFGISGDIPITGDWNGNGYDTIGVFRPATAQFFLDYDNDGVSDMNATFGVIGDTPVVGDWDGDGDDNIGVFRQNHSDSGLTMFFRDFDNSGGSADQSVAFGEPDDLHVIGDWDGDGDDNIGLYRPGTTTGVFYLDIDNDGGSADIVTPEYGDLGDIPVAGDWDGDSDDNIGVYRPGTGEFFMDATVPDVLSSKTIYVDDDFSDDPSEHKWDTIQEGVDDAADRDTVIVYAGTYNENVDVDKRVTLIGEGKNTTIINGDGNADVIRVTADGCTVSGFTIQSRESSIVDEVEIRGEVATGSFTWTPMTFSGFYHDLNANVGDETLTIVTSGRTVEEGDLVYGTTSDLIDFEYCSWGGYQVIGFMAEKYFAGYDENTHHDITDETINLLSNDVLTKVLIDEDETYTISRNASLQLEENYELKIIQLDVNGAQVQLELLHNDEHVDTAIISAPDTYVYKTDIGNVSNVSIIAVHIDSVFAGTETDMVTIDGIFQISDDYVSIETGTDFGVMEVKAVSSSAVLLKNEEYVDLDEDCTEHIMGDIYLVTADNDSLRFYPMVRYREPGVYAIRGEIQYVAGTNPEIIWDARNFGGFYYDLDEDRSTETLTVAADTINCGAGDRIIDENRLIYRTAPVAKQYELNENEGCTVESSNPDGDAFYWIEGWVGESRVAINNKANKLCRLLVEFEDDDKKTLATGEAWDLGRGFVLTARQIDHDGDSVWLSLSKNGKELDNQIINTDTGNEQDRIYTYTADIGGEEKIPVFSCYVDAVFRGTDTSVVQIMYVFLIDDHVLEIETGDRYGAMEVITASSSEIILKNDETTIDLGAGTTVPIMGRLSFKAADDGTTIRFYPFVEVVVGSSPIVEIAGIGLVSSNNNSLTDNRIRLSVYGIRIQNSNNNTLTGNNINSNNEHGIYISASSNNTITGNAAKNNGNCGIFLCSSDSNIITGNIADNNNYYGIKMESSSSNTLAGNIVNSNNWNGIDLWYSGNNTLTGNTISNNRYNFGLYGWNDAHFDNNIDITNLVDGKPISYIRGVSDIIIDSAIGAGTIYCIQCDNITVKNITLSNNGAGVLFWKTNNSTIQDVNTSNNDYGICLWNSSDNKLTRNTILSNSRGIDVQSSSDDMLADNMVSSNWEGINLRNSGSSNLTSNNANSNTVYGINLWNSDSTVLMGNTISNNWKGINLRNSCSNNLTSNIVSENDDGINLRNSGGNLLNTNTVSGNDNGIYLDYSNSNTLIDNSVDLNDWNGIYLWRSNYNTLTNNTANSNDYGIYLSGSSNNILEGNTMSGNLRNFGVWGNCLSHYIQNIPTSNTVDGKPIYYWVDRQDEQIIGDAGFVGVVNSTNITVKDLTLTKNHAGMLFAYTENSRIENVTASDNSCGIFLSYSGKNVLQNNNCSNNNGGISIWYSSENTLTSNTASNAYCGISLYSSSGNTMQNNIANSNKICGIDLYYSSSNTLRGNNASNNDDGVGLSRSSDNILSGNTANSNDNYGIDIYYSSNNTLSGNSVSNNWLGIGLKSSSDNNALHHNNLINNTYHNAHDSGTNTWDSGSVGNYWSDYTGTDPDGDGIGNDPYPIPGGTSIDRYPLMQPWAGDTPQKGDLNSDGILTPADAAIALQIAAGGSASCDPAMLAAADVSGDNRVTSLDALMTLQAAVGMIEL